MDAVFGAWHGGASYSAPDLPADLERFESLEEAAAVLKLRSYATWPTLFPYLNRTPETTRCPAVDEDCEMHVWLIDPTDVTDPYPDYIIRLDENRDPIIERA